MRFVPTLASLFAVSVLVTASAGAHAQAVYKCRVDGKLSYSDRPCPGGGETLPPPPAGIAAAGGMGTGDSRTLLDIEKLRTERMKQDAIENREARARARTGRVRVQQIQRCDKLRLQHKWSEEDVAKARTPAQQDAARTKLRRQLETMAVECPA